MQLCSLAAGLPRRFEGELGLDHSGLQPCSHVALQPCSLAAMQLCSLAARRKEETTPFGVNLMRSQVLYRAAQ